ncbi:unnamed protein product, partial [Effrenium voratum]
VDFSFCKVFALALPACSMALPTLFLPTEPLRPALEAFADRVCRTGAARAPALSAQQQRWASDDGCFPWLPQMRGILRDWGHEGFRGLQLPVINALMSGKDVFAVMPTGAGKSLCYQLPAMVLQGTTVVVSPLLSLMEDQVCSLQERHVQAARLGSDATPERSNSRVLQDLAQDALKLLYVSPERVVEDKGPKSKGSSLGRVLRELHHRKKLSLLVVDEAHCISQWGMDFRKVYRKLACLRQTYPGVRILATTASATKKVEEDVLKSLNLRDAISFHD